MNKNVKLKSGALQISVFIAIIIAFLLSCLILLAYTFGYFKQQSKVSIENYKLANSAIVEILDQKELSKDTLIKEINSFKIKTHLSQWGDFKKAFVKIENRGKILKKIAFVGSIYESKTTPTLYLQETFNPLTIVGNTILKGNLFLPSQGLKAGFINSQGFVGNSLFEGTSTKSTKQLPKLDDTFINNFRSFNQENSSYRLDNSFLTNSFSNETKIIQSAQDIIIDNIELIGNIIVSSKSMIIIKKNSKKIKDVIFIAPKIILEDGVNGNFQLLATKRIEIGENSKLNYPSSVILCKEDNNVISKEDKLEINGNCLIQGNIYYLTKHIIDDNYNANIFIANQSIVNGQVYCQGNIELEGTISGSVYTKQFIVTNSGSIYINHIFNGVITNFGLPKYYSGISLDNQKYCVIKWLF